MAKQTTSDTGTYECAVPYSLDLDGIARTVRHGEILRGDDPAYVAMYCSPVGTPHVERPKISDFAVPGVQTEHHGLPSGDRSRTGGLRLGH